MVEGIIYCAISDGYLDEKDLEELADIIERIKYYENI